MKKPIKYIPLSWEQELELELKLKPKRKRKQWVSKIYKNLNSK